MGSNSSWKLSKFRICLHEHPATRLFRQSSTDVDLTMEDSTIDRQCWVTSTMDEPTTTTDSSALLIKHHRHNNAIDIAYIIILNENTRELNLLGRLNLVTSETHRPLKIVCNGLKNTLTSYGNVITYNVVILKLHTNVH